MKSELKNFEKFKQYGEFEGIVNFSYETSDIILRRKFYEKVNFQKSRRRIYRCGNCFIVCNQRRRTFNLHIITQAYAVNAYALILFKPLFQLHIKLKVLAVITHKLYSVCSLSH